MSQATALPAIEITEGYRTHWLLHVVAALGLGASFLYADRLMPGQTDTTSQVRQVALVCAGLLGCMLLLARSGRSFACNNFLSLVLLVYLSLCLVSVTWTDYTGLWFKRVSVRLLCLVCAIGICRQFSPRDLCRMVLAISSVYLCIGILAEITGGTYEPSAERFRFRGTFHMNHQGINCAFICLSAACLHRQATRWRWALATMFLVGVFFLILTGSRTGLYSFLCAVVLYWWLTGSWQRKISLAAFLALLTSPMLLAVVMGAEDQVADFLNMGRDRATVSTMTGRMPVWNELTGYISKRPLFGYGYEGFWSDERYDEFTASMKWAPSHAHSAYLEIILSLGLLGGFLHVLAIVAGLYRGRRQYLETRDGGYGFVFGLLLMATVHSLLEGTFATPSCYASTVFFAGLFMLAFQRNVNGAYRTGHVDDEIVDLTTFVQPLDSQKMEFAWDGYEWTSARDA